MSQTTRFKVRAAERHRRAVARELAAFVVPPGPAPIAGGLVEAGRADAILAGALHFDVHAAREHARTLVALADEQAVFEDWTRAKGLGPENREPGAHHEPWRTWVVDIDKAAAGVWELVVDGITVQSEDFYATASASSISAWLAEAESRHDIWPDSPNAVVVEGLVSSVELRAPVDGEYSITCVSEVRIDGGWPGKLAREWPGDSRAPMGRSLARLGQRILDMLEGQPSECQHPVCQRFGPASALFEQPCPDCHGTGHNLRGKLPGVEWSPAVRRKVSDGCQAEAERYLKVPGWRMHETVLWWRRYDVPGAGLDGLTRWDHERGEIVRDERTRVCPRGEHRLRNEAEPGGWYRSPVPGRGRSRVTGYLAMRWCPQSTMPRDLVAGPARARTLMPCWRRGELEHARQRREREALREARILEHARSVGAPADAFMRLAAAVQGVA